MGTINTIHSYRVDLDDCPLAVQLTQPLSHQDALADVFRVTVRRGMNPVDLTGMTVTAYLTFGETRQTLPLSGIAQGSAASVTLTGDCYKLPGLFTLVMQLTDGDVRHTILRVSGLIDRTSCEEIISPGELLPALPELLEEVADMRQATADAQAAAALAQAAADNVRAATDALSRNTAPAVELEASGEVIRLTDGAARPALSLVSQISAVQKGSGDPTPDNIRPIVGWDALTLTRSGRNMLDPAALVQVQISTGETRWGMQYTRPGTYALHANVAGGDADYVYARVTDGSGAAVGDTMYLVVGSAIKAYTVTLEAGQTLTVWYVRDLDQATAAECLARTQVQVEMGSRTAYVPGQSAAITAALPETVYGGNLDWTTGVLTVTHELVTLDGGRTGYVQSVNDAGIVNVHFDYAGGWVTEGMQISHFYYLNKSAATTTEECFLAVNGSLYLRIARERLGGETWADVNAYLRAQVAAGTPVQVLHRLKEPRTVQLDPQTLALLRGENRIWSEAGVSAVGYIADTKIYIDNAVAAIAASVINA